jgi:hypothetical protein
VLLFFTLASALAFLALWKFEPQSLEHVTRAHLERLLPYLAGPAAILALLTISWGLRWGSTRRTAWLSIVLAGALVASSFLGRLNPGGYLNVLMPAFAGVSILFGLGVSEAAKPFPRHSPGRRRITGVVVLALAAAQLLAMPSPLTSPLPSEADAAAGTALVRKIAECPGDVYLPFQTYLSQLAGKSPHAGWIETAELAGFFGGGPDPLWEEVKGQIESALRSRSFAGVIQDNFVFGELSSDEYEPVGRVFSRDDLFWPVTGWRIRPEVIYQPVGRETCDLEVE